MYVHAAPALLDYAGINSTSMYSVLREPAEPVEVVRVMSNRYIHPTICNIFWNMFLVSYSITARTKLSDILAQALAYNSSAPCFQRPRSNNSAPSFLTSPLSLLFSYVFPSRNNLMQSISSINLFKNAWQKTIFMF